MAAVSFYMRQLRPVGKEQRQHSKWQRHRTSFNKAYGETLVVPEARIEESVMTVPGTDGLKMSKSYGNIIDIFLPEKDLLKQIKTIKTDSKPIEEPKIPEQDSVFALYTLLADSDQRVH